MIFQQWSDAFLDRTLLPLIPQRMTPNQVSWARIAALPFLGFFLWNQQYFPGFVLFALAALTDALDGAMARTRNQVTETGKILDALADRGLIALVALAFVPHYFGWWLVIVPALLEALNGALAWRSRMRLGHNPGANWGGKIKMIIQCIAFCFLFLAMLLGTSALMTIAYALLVLSIFFILLQAFLYP